MLITLFNCGANKKVSKRNESYGVISALLEYYDDKNVYKRDAIILTDSILKFDKDDFFNSIAKFQEQKKYAAYSPKCVDEIHEQFNQDSSYLVNDLDKVWNYEKVTFPKSKVKSISNLVLGENYISLSRPLFNTEKNLILIKGNKGNTGEILYFLKRKQKKWVIDCELFLSYY
ncbi:hypothetical protein MHTCC0001_35750 [Flavobacteriaceae bacterium MHTCC 0001]